MRRERERERERERKRDDGFVVVVACKQGMNEEMKKAGPSSPFIACMSRRLGGNNVNPNESMRFADMFEEVDSIRIVCLALLDSIRIV